MGGVYGEINSRDDFFRVLDEARALARGILNASPKNKVMESIDTQLDAMWRWTQGGREPLDDEKKSICVGLLAVRELDQDAKDESGVLCNKLYALNNYFEEWPTDDEAASATDADYWARFGL